MGERLNKLKANLQYDKKLWSVAYESEEGDALHFLLKRKYDQKVSRIIRPNLVNDVYCSIGIHLYDKKSYAKPTIVIDSVIWDNNGQVYKLYQDLFVKIIRRPIDLDFGDEFIIDALEMKIYKKRNKKEIPNIPEYLYSLHTKPVKLFGGLGLRTKLFIIKKIIWKVPVALSMIMRCILFLMNGSRFQKDNISMAINTLIGNKNELKKIGDGKAIDFMAIKVNVPSAFTYSLIHLIAAFLYFSFSFHNEFISKIANNVFLGLAYVVVSLTLWESIIPVVLERMIIHLAKVTYDLQIKPFRV